MTNNSKVLVVQSYNTKYAELAALARPNKESYARLHGYDFVDIPREWNDFRDSTWLIPTTIYMLLWSDKEHDWFYWTDVDSLIMNYQIPLETFTSNISEDVCIIASLWSYESNKTYLNLDGDIEVIETQSIWFLIHTGNMLVRNCEWSRRFFSILCDDYRFSRKDLLTAPGGDEFGLTVHYLSKPEIRNRFLFRSNDDFISFDYSAASYEAHAKRAGIKNYEQGDFIIHFPLRALSTRIELMRKHCHLPLHTI